MSKYSTSAVILTVIWCVLMIAWIMITSINNTSCNAVRFATFADMMADFGNYKFSTGSTRKTAETVARAKLKASTDSYANSLSVKDLSDNAVFAIIVSSIATTNPTFIDVINHYRYIECVKDYNLDLKQFVSMRSIVVSILKNKHIPDLAEDSIDDPTLFDMLINGSKPVLAPAVAVSTSAVAGTT